MRVFETDLTREDIAAWKNNTVTKEIFAMITDMIAEETYKLNKGCTINFESAEATALKTADITGYIRGLEELVAMEFMDDEEDDGE